MTNAKVELSIKELESIISALELKLAHLKCLGPVHEVRSTQNLIDKLQDDLEEIEIRSADEEPEQEMDESQNNSDLREITLKDLREEYGNRR